MSKINNECMKDYLAMRGVNVHESPIDMVKSGSFATSPRGVYRTTRGVVVEWLDRGGDLRSYWYDNEDFEAENVDECPYPPALLDMAANGAFIPMFEDVYGLRDYIRGIVCFGR